MRVSNTKLFIILLFKQSMHCLLKRIRFRRITLNMISNFDPRVSYIPDIISATYNHISMLLRINFLTRQETICNNCRWEYLSQCVLINDSSRFYVVFQNIINLKMECQNKKDNSNLKVSSLLDYNSV